MIGFKDAVSSRQTGIFQAKSCSTVYTVTGYPRHCSYGVDLCHMSFKEILKNTNIIKVAVVIPVPL
jgi:expansin (peptidoglycan-binding protein)